MGESETALSAAHSSRCVENENRLTEIQRTQTPQQATRWTDQQVTHTGHSSAKRASTLEESNAGESNTRSPHRVPGLPSATRGTRKPLDCQSLFTHAGQRTASRKALEPDRLNCTNSSVRSASCPTLPEGQRPRRFVWFVPQPLDEPNTCRGRDDSTHRSKHSQFGIWLDETDIEQRHPPHSTLHLNWSLSPQKSASTRSNLRQNPNSASRSVKRS